MTDHTSPNDGRYRPATGALASFARKCASHPRRVLAIWFVSTLALIALVVVAHGTLVNEFKLPGSDTQRASDLLEGEVPCAERQRAHLRVQGPRGPDDHLAEEQGRDQPDHRPRKEDAEYATRTTSPFEKGNLSDTKRVGFFDQSFSKQSFDLSWTKTKALMDKSQAIAEKAGLNLQFTGERRRRALIGLE